MNLWKDIQSIPGFLVRNRSKIFKRLLAYFLILLAMSPIIFIYRTEIYTTLLSRHDDWHLAYYTEDGIPVTDYGYQAGAYVGEQITARAVANSAIGYDQLMDAGNATAGVYFNATVDWLLENRNDQVVTTENGSVTITNWPYDFGIWDIPNGWQSAMVDAKALHVFALAYDRYGNSSLPIIAEQIASGFEVSADLGGNLMILEDDNAWYPEVVIPSVLNSNYQSPMILNGFLFALRHMYVANQIFNISKFDTIFDIGIKSAAENLYKYDSSYEWSLYSLEQPLNLASTKYHRIHIDLLKELYNYTSNETFKTYYEKWEQFTSRPSFTWEEIFSADFIYYGLLIVILIMIPVLAIDATQYIVRSQLRNRKNQTSVE